METFHQRPHELGFLNKHYRDQVLLEAEVQYDAA